MLHNLLRKVVSKSQYSAGVILYLDINLKFCDRTSSFHAKNPRSPIKYSLLCKQAVPEENIYFLKDLKIF